MGGQNVVLRTVKYGFISTARRKRPAWWQKWLRNGGCDRATEREISIIEGSGEVGLMFNTDGGCLSNGGCRRGAP